MRSRRARRRALRAVLAPVVAALTLLAGTAGATATVAPRASALPGVRQVATWVAAGVKVAMGTDSGVGPHGSNLRELALMAAGGMAPADVLVATTRSAAELLGVLDECGTLTTGKRADIVAVAGDPFDFTDLKSRIRAVYAGGRLVRGAE